MECTGGGLGGSGSVNAWGGRMGGFGRRAVVVRWAAGVESVSVAVAVGGVDMGLRTVARLIGKNGGKYSTVQ